MFINKINIKYILDILNMIYKVLHCSYAILVN